MLKKYNTVFICAVSLLLFLLTGCMSVDCVMKETFSPTDTVKVYDKAADIPYDYSIIGVCQTEGNYTEYSYDDMINEIMKRGMENGADGILVLGMRVVPDGRVVQTSPLRSSLDSASTGNSWAEINKDFGGGYGNVRSKSFGASQTYDRIIRVNFIRFKRDANGEFIARPAEDRAKTDKKEPLIKIEDLKKEIKK